MKETLSYIWANLWWMWPGAIGFVCFVNWMFWLKAPDTTETLLNDIKNNQK